MSRPYCYQCHRPQQACVCDYVRPVANAVKVTILQHPTETKNAKGSAVIAQLGLENCQLWVGEDFTQHEALNQFLDHYAGKCYLVYPCAEAMSLPQLAEQIDNQDKLSQAGIQLIFIDATWNKAKKIYYSSANLRSLPCVAISPAAGSNYRIRKQPNEQSLATVEAVVHCLSWLELNETKYQPLLAAFERMIDFQIENMGEAVYRQNYSDKR